MSEYETKAKIDLKKEGTNIAIQRFTGLMNNLYSLGFLDKDMMPRVGIGYRGDAAIVLQDNRLGDPIFTPDKQIELIEKFVSDNEGVGYKVHPDVETGAYERPVCVVLENGDMNKKVFGLEADKIVIYQPAEPDVTDFMRTVAKEMGLKGKMSI